VIEAGGTRSARYLNLGLLALARLPLSEEDSLRNLRLQVQALINRYQHRKAWGAPAQEALAQALLGVMARNPSLNAAHYRAFLTTLLAPLGEDTSISVLRLLGFSNAALAQRYAATISSDGYRLQPPDQAPETRKAVEAIRHSRSLEQAWKAIRPLLSTHENFVHKSGDAYHFIPTLDMCARALCKRYTIPDPEIQGRLFQWMHLALQMDADDPGLWMLWELVLRQAGYPQRARWVLWEMTRRFPDNLPCRVELARLLAASSDPLEQAQAQRLLQQVLQLDPEHLHAYSTLAQLAIGRGDWSQALNHAQRGLHIEPAHEASAVLLATAYARRGDVSDLEMAIDHLQRFTGRYPGQLRAEGYLSKLLRRRELVSQGQSIEYEGSEEPANSGPVLPERDPAWLAFAKSIRTWAAAEDSTPSIEDPSSIDRVLPLPQALRHAVAQGQWETDILDQYEPAAQQEFPLETRLWRYLQTLHSSAASDGDRDRAKRALGAWIEAELRAPTDESPSWGPYLSRFWESMSAPMNAALAAGTDWLKGLLDRYQPLPAPLFV
jgi:tetratricopeptide (TPR) repeat protein